MNSIVICLAESEHQQEMMYRLRYETYTTEIKSFGEEEFPDGRERDKYDDHSIHIIACEGAAVIGTLRLVKDSDLGFVMETAFKLPASIERTRAVEHSRGIIRPAYRKRKIYPRMLEFAYAWQRENGFPICLGAPNMERLHGILLTMGWTAIGEPRYYHGITVIPMMHILI